MTPKGMLLDASVLIIKQNKFIKKQTKSYFNQIGQNVANKINDERSKNVPNILLILI